MRWVSWAAVSSLPQAKKISNEDQLAENRRHAAMHGGQVVAELVVPGESRSIVLFEDAARRIEAYAELKRLIDARAFDVLVYLDRSRLGRKASLSMSVVELCHSAGIATYETENPPASITPTGTHDDALIGAIKSVGAQQEVDKLKRRHTMGMLDRARKGKLPASPPTGYYIVYDKDGAKQIQVDEAGASIVRRIFALYLDGHGTPTIADKLNSDGIPSPTGTAWAKAAIRYIIHNRWTYAGYAEINKRSEARPYLRGDGNHAAIITEETAQMVDAEIAARMENRKLADTIYHLSGICYCMECRRAMHCVLSTTVINGRTYQSVKLRCTRHTPPHYASYRNALSDLRAAIMQLDDENIAHLVRSDTQLADAILGQIAEQEAIIEKVTAGLQRADDAFVSGAMDAERYGRQVDRLNGQVAAARNEIARLRRRYDDEADAAKHAERIRQVSSLGLAKLDGDATTGNAWLRRYVRLWMQDGNVVGVEWL